MKSSYNGVSDTEMIPTTGAMVAALTKDSTLFQTIMSFLPTEEQLKDAHGNFQTSYNEALGGDREKAVKLEADRQVLDKRFSIFTALVKLAAEEDASLLAKAGVTQPQVKRTSSGTTMTAPANFQVRHGQGHGVIIGKAGSVKPARSYEMQFCEGDPTIEENWKYAGVSVHASRLEMNGLTPGKVYSFRVRGIGANGPGPWSSYVTLMAI